MDKKVDINKAVEMLDLDPRPPHPIVEVEQLGSKYKIQVLGYLPFRGEPATPYSLGKEIGLGRSLSTSETMELIQRYSERRWNGLLDLENYTETMLIAQTCSNIFRARNGTIALTSTAALRNNGRLQIGIRPKLENGEIKEFSQGVFSAEDIQGEVKNLNNVTLWPASEGLSVARETYSRRGTAPRPKTASVAVQFGKQEYALIASDAEFYSGFIHNAKLPIVKRITN